MLLNMLNDLTEAMKALDGKKMGLICFWTFSGLCMMVQTFLVPTFMDKNFNGVYEIHLLHASHLQKEFGRFSVFSRPTPSGLPGRYTFNRSKKTHCN